MGILRCPHKPRYLIWKHLNIPVNLQLQTQKCPDKLLFISFEWGIWMGVAHVLINRDISFENTCRHFPPPNFPPTFWHWGPMRGGKLGKAAARPQPQPQTHKCAEKFTQILQKSHMDKSCHPGGSDWHAGIGEINTSASWPSLKGQISARTCRGE